MTNPTSNSTIFLLFPSSNFQLMIFFFFVICRQKKVRFPKGKKVKSVDERVDRGKAEEEGPSDLKDPRLAAKERAMLRNLITDEGFSGHINDASAAEVAYEENENFVEDGIQIEPFNLEREREEGYFDAEGNFVEYINENEIKDAWLDSVQVHERYVGKTSVASINEDDEKDDGRDLSSEEIGMMKSRIANLLEPGETVLQALRRLKGRSNKSKEKMSTETQLLFDQLTEDANKLLDHGEYNVYHDKQEVFKREAEGYERLALARGKVAAISEGLENSGNGMEKGLSSGVTGLGTASSAPSDVDVGPSIPSVSTAEISGCDGDAFDMFGDDEDNATAIASQQSSDGLNAISGAGSLQNDYVYDETSGYYYSSSLGYYYDPSTGLYCQATSGQWYSFNEETGTYNEIQEVASNAN
ncbi:SUPPRESSOR OF ABI3-5-like [Populus alba x Populus x berolinensis]|uniref:SUPPRESSOR OF ABI3-5-like n=1 Tax=Populus alba x Populus x berolinensis TaxID=444605 RepID=A0AAD6R5X9_9ROSI|nr:SUPPRESSOR OF ABI3-5-like [Populus alba x Populus x berolinensis]